MEVHPMVFQDGRDGQEWRGRRRQPGSDSLALGVQLSMLRDLQLPVYLHLHAPSTVSGPNSGTHNIYTQV